MILYRPVFELVWHLSTAAVSPSSFRSKEVLLDSQQMSERDRMVFESAKRAGVPIAWNLAGGYQDPISRVIRIHHVTMEECVRVYVRLSAL